MFGHIESTTTESGQEWDIEIALGLATYHHMLGRDDIAKMRIDSQAPDCVVWEWTEGNTTHKWDFDPARAYALTRCQVLNGPSDGELAIEYRMEDIRPVNGVLLPFRVHKAIGRDLANLKGERFVTREITLEIAQYRLDDPLNAPEYYHIRWPDGTRVTDHRAGVSFIAHGGNPVYDDGRIYDEALLAIAASEPNEPVGSSNHNDAGDATTISSGVQQVSADVNELATSRTTTNADQSTQWLYAGVILVVGVAVAGVLYLRGGHPQ